MAEEAATADEEEGEIHEDQKLEPSRDGESEGLGALEAEEAEVDEVGSVDFDVSGGSASPEARRLGPASLRPLACEVEAAAELMLSCQRCAHFRVTGVFDLPLLGSLCIEGSSRGRVGERALSATRCARSIRTGTDDDLTIDGELRSKKCWSMMGKNVS